MALDEFGDIFGGGDIFDTPSIPDSPLPGLGGPGFDFGNFDLGNLGGGGGGATPDIGALLKQFGGTNPFNVEQSGRDNTGLFDTFLKALTGRGGQAVGASLGLGAGLAGLIQTLAGGGRVSTQQINHRQSAQEQQLTGQTLQALQRLQGLAGNQEINNAVNRLASGQLPISPDLVKQVTSAFGATAGNLAQNSIENARQRGFAGGMDLLPGAGSPQYSQSLAQLQSDVSQALVNLALGLPVTASNINAQQAGIMGQGIGQQNDLLRALQSQNQTDVRTVGPQQTLLQALGPFSQVLGATGGLLGGMNAFNQGNQAGGQNRQPIQQPYRSIQ